MKKNTRFNITISVLAVILVISIALLVKVYMAGRNNDTTESTASTQIVTTVAGQTNDPSQTDGSSTEETGMTSETETGTETTPETTIPETTIPETTAEESSAVDPTVVEARSMYLGSGYAASDSVLDSIIALSKTTELNAVVIDVKEGGMVLYDSHVPEVRDNGLYAVDFDPAHAVRKLKDAGIYVIARIVCFKDNLYAQKYPDRAIKKPDGTIAKSDKSAWANPYIEANWDYNIAIAKEVAGFGFDEIQFDYVRFPSLSKSSADYGEADIPEYSRAQAIADFLEKAYGEIHPLGVNLSADVFAIACISDLDARAIGQRVDWIAKYVDYICPMIYPSHYANSSTGPMGNGEGQGINGVHFSKPDLFPYEVVYNTLLSMNKMLEGKEGIIAKVRSYIQGFTASYLSDGYYKEYGAQEIRAQIQGVYDAGYSEWIIWNGGTGKAIDGVYLAD